MNPNESDLKKLRDFAASIISAPVPEMETEDGQAIALEFVFRLESFVRKTEKEIFPNE